jgi:hypothetical protein
MIGYFTLFQRWHQAFGPASSVYRARDHSGRVNRFDARVEDQEFEALSIADDSKNRYPMLHLRVYIVGS